MALPLRKIFKPEQFKFHIEGKFWTAQDKAKWANQFVRFVRSGFDRQYFNKSMYNHLHQHMGFIAYYDQDGFWHSCFNTLDRCIDTLHYLTRGSALFGNPDYTWSDVGQAIIQWIEINKIIEHLEIVQAEQIKNRNLRLRDELVAKYGVA